MQQTTATRPAPLIAAATIVLATFLAYVLAEGLGRLSIYFTLRERILAQLTTIPTGDPQQGNSIYHPDMGYSYRPNITGVHRDDKYDIRFHINSWGHVSDDEYPMTKPDDEYRIVVVGDSFSAGVHCKTRWPAVLEEHLRGSAAWSAHVGGKRTRVINVARDGIGLVQFDKVLAGDGLRFSPDLVLASFVSDDLTRKPYFRGNLTVAPEDKQAHIAAHANAMLSKLPWFSLSPEYAMTKLGLSSRLLQRIQLVNEQRHYADKDEAARMTSDSVKRMRAVHSRVHLLHHPDYHDFRGEVPGHLTGVMDKFRTLLPGVHIESMIKRFPTHTEREMQSWFLYPHDLHPNDTGLTMYAQYVFDYLMEQIARRPNGRAL